MVCGCGRATTARVWDRPVRVGRPTARPHSTAVRDADDDDDARGGVDVDARRVSRERRREGVVVVVGIGVIIGIIGIGSRTCARDGDATSTSSSARDAVRVHGIGHVRFVGRRGRRGGDVR